MPLYKYICQTLCFSGSEKTVKIISHAFPLVLSVSSSSWCLGRAVPCDCGTPWTFLLPFLQIFIYQLSALDW